MKNYTAVWTLIAAFSISIFSSVFAADLTPIRTLSGHTDSVRSVAFSLDGKKVLSGSWDNTAKVWDVQTGKLQRTHKFDFWVTGVAFSPNGATYLTASPTATSSLSVWDIRTGALRRMVKSRDAGTPIAFSPDGRTLANGKGIGIGEIRLLDTRTDKLKVTLKMPDKNEQIVSIAFSPDGKLLASGNAKNKRFSNPKEKEDNGNVKLWDARTGQLLRTLESHTSYVSSVVFSPDGKTLASGSSDATIKLWDIHSGSIKRTLKSDVFWDGVFSVAFSPDGKTLASGNVASLKIWNPETGKVLHTLRGHGEDAVYSVAFSPNGKILASGSQDHTVKLWEIPTTQPRAHE